MKFNLGANNLLYTKPKSQTPNYTKVGGRWDSLQMGYTRIIYYPRVGCQL